MRYFSILILFTLVLWPTSISQAQDQLPINEGSFVTSQADCTLLKKGELEFVEFFVSENGREYSLPEIGCVVAEVKHIRGTRYHVKADCTEFDDISENQFFLDVLPNKNIRIDGKELILCEWDGVIQKTEIIKPIVTIPVKKAEVPNSASQKVDKKNISVLIKQWEVEEENCRGGSGDNPKTAKACNRRNNVIQKLEKAGWCLGQNDQSRADVRWHKCQKNSIRSF